jgi:hypothetical protein
MRKIKTLQERIDDRIGRTSLTQSNPVQLTPSSTGRIVSQPAPTTTGDLADHLNATDPHTQYYDETRGDERYARINQAPTFSSVHLGSGELLFGATDDVNLYRSAEGNLQTDNDIQVTGIYIEATTSTSNAWMTNYGATLPGMICRRAKGTKASPTNVVAADVLGFYGARGYGASTFPNVSTGAYTIKAEESFTDTSNATRLSLETTPTGSTTRVERVRIKSGGDTSFGDNKVLFGTFGSEDVNLYKSASNVLKTDDAFIANTFQPTTSYKAVDGSVGVSGSFTTVDGKTITVEDGLITSIV